MSHQSRVPDQNGISQACYIAEIHSGRTPSRFKTQVSAITPKWLPIPLSLTDTRTVRHTQSHRNKVTSPLLSRSHTQTANTPVTNPWHFRSIQRPLKLLIKLCWGFVCLFVHRSVTLNSYIQRVSQFCNTPVCYLTCPRPPPPPPPPHPVLLAEIVISWRSHHLRRETIFTLTEVTTRWEHMFHKRQQ